MIGATEAVPTFDHHRACQHKMYRLTCEEFDALYAVARGCCQLCGTPEGETRRERLQIDHAPDYGLTAVRGLLCPKCNTRMGLADRGHSVEGAVAYRHNAWFLRVVAERGYVR